MAAFMGRDVKRLKAKGGGKVSNFFSSHIPHIYHNSCCMIHDSCESHRCRTSAFLI